jgi:hypothetical protein
MRFEEVGGAVIGYRRCRAVHAVQQQIEGAYTIEGNAYEPTGGGQLLYVEAMTEFEDADGATCVGIALVAGAELAAGVKPGRLWLQPGELVGGHEIAGQVVSIPLRKTVREQIKVLVRF